jgi:hypothetical protein
LVWIWHYACIDTQHGKKCSSITQIGLKIVYVIFQRILWHFYFPNEMFLSLFFFPLFTCFFFYKNKHKTICENVFQASNKNNGHFDIHFTIIFLLYLCFAPTLCLLMSNRQKPIKNSRFHMVTNKYMAQLDESKE